jgi:hypothetical protein
MTDLSRLKVSLTKHGAHKAFHLLRDLNTSQVLASVWNKHDGIKIDLAQTRQNLSAFADGNLPGVWDRAKALSDDTLRQLVFLAIVFSHHKVIEAFQVGALSAGTGEITRGDVLDTKAFTNIKNDIVELGFSTQHNASAVAYNLSELWKNSALGELAGQLLALKLQSAGWNTGGDVVDECVRLGFHQALAQGEDVFRLWLGGGRAIDMEPEQAAPDPNVAVRKAFLFSAGHRPAKEGKSARKIEREDIEADLTHNMLQSKLYAFLAQKHGAESVGTEQPSGIGANSIDVVLRIGEEITFFELKTNPSLRTCIREALPQLLEYAYWPAEVRSTKLVIVAEAVPTQDAIEYLQKLRCDFSIPVHYARIDRSTGSLDNLI